VANLTALEAHLATSGDNGLTQVLNHRDLFLGREVIGVVKAVGGGLEEEAGSSVPQHHYYGDVQTPVVVGNVGVRSQVGHWVEDPLVGDRLCRGHLRAKLERVAQGGAES